MNWGFLVLCCLMAAGLMHEAIKHGEPKTGKYNIWTSIPAMILQLVLILWAMHWRV